MKITASALLRVPTHRIRKNFACTDSPGHSSAVCKSRCATPCRRSWHKGAWASLDGKIGQLTMDPDSDSEVKLKWANGEVSRYVKINLLTPVAGGKHTSHSHNLAPSNLSSGWICDVCRDR